MLSRYFPLALFFLSNTLCSYASADFPGRFRLHINSEPQTLSPLKQKGAAGAFLFTAVHASLLWFDRAELFPYLGKCKQVNSHKIDCEINSAAKFSNGEPIKASHFLRSFKHLLNPTSPGLRADILLGIKNAEQVLSGKLPFERLGVTAKDNQLIFDLERSDYEFIYNLANPILAPTFNENTSDDFLSPQSVFSGPYQIKAWEQKQKITLVPNPHFLNEKSIQRPEIEFYFFAEDSLALNVYEKGQLDFLRRLPTLYIPKYRDNPEYHSVDQFRFDYFGFGPSLKQLPLLRKVLAESLDYKELQDLFSSKPRPGCAGIPAPILPHPTCIDTKISQQDLSQKPESHVLSFSYSKQGGDDVDRSVQWIQSQWKKNLNLQVQLQQMDNKVFLDQLRQSPSSVFHVGLSPSRATCLAVLENFLPNAPENWIQFKDPKMDQIVNKMRLRSDRKTKSSLCEQGIGLLVKSHWLIPTGPEYFSMLAKPQWVGWRLNELNQLNLADLHLAAKF